MGTVMKKTAIMLVLLFAASALFASPLRDVEKGSVIDLKKFSYGKGYNAENDRSRLKFLYIWKSDKRLSKKQYEAYRKLCSEYEITCLALDQQGIGGSDTHIINITDKNGYTDNWGIIALPVTVILDENNTLIEAVGYEGQYVSKMSHLIDSIIKK